MEPRMKLNDAVFALEKRSRQFNAELEDIAWVLRQFGSDRLAERIEGVSEGLSASVSEIRTAYGERLTEDLREAQEGAGLLLKAALVGCLVPPRKAKKGAA